MTKKKILIVSRSFYPDISPRSFRTTELVKEFARQGHLVTLVTNERDFDYSVFLRSYPIAIKNLGKLRFKRLEKSKWGLIGDWKRKFGRLLSMLFNYPEIELMWPIRRVLKNERGHDLLISIAVPFPVHWGTAWARTATHQIAKTWVADCGDPYFKNTLESFRIPFYFAFVEKWFSRKTDFLTVPFEGLLDDFFEEFHPKIRVIPQGFKFDETNIEEYEPARYNKPRFAYAGGVAAVGVRNLVGLLKRLLTIDVDFEFHVFPTTGRDLVIPFCEESKGKIVLNSIMERQELLPILAQMDFLVNLMIEGTETKQVPSKLIDYALSRRPILNIDPIDPDADLIREFLNADYSRAYIVENIQQYNIENVAKQFLSLAD